jgi:hypothetical protein
MAEALGPTSAATSHVRQGRAAARAAQVRWRASRPQQQVADDLSVVWHAGYPWVPSGDPATALAELRRLLGDRNAVTVTVCAELPLADLPLAVTVVRAVDVLDHSTGPEDVPWLRVTRDGVLFGIMLKNIVWIRSGYWGAHTGLPGDPAVDDVAARLAGAGADPLPMRGEDLADYLTRRDDDGQLLHTSLRLRELSPPPRRRGCRRSGSPDATSPRRTVSATPAAREGGTWSSGWMARPRRRWSGSFASRWRRRRRTGGSCTAGRTAWPRRRSSPALGFEEGT